MQFSLPDPPGLMTAPGFRHRRRKGLSILLLLLTSGFAAAQTFTFGAGSGWNGTVSENLREIDGWRGNRALTLAPLGRNPFLSDSSVIEGEVGLRDIDILLLAEAEGVENPVGRYRIAGEYEISRLYSARGESSIRPRNGGLTLQPTPMSMWYPGRTWGDFTLDFRLRPSTLREGEVFFSWQGRTEDGSTQNVVARVKNRRLVWEFRGFFRHDIDRSLTLELSSPPLIPGEWRHHRIRFQSDTSGPDRSGASPGLLEYLVDGVPSDMVHATVYGREGSEQFSPHIGVLSTEPLRIAPAFSGYLDEFRLVSVFDASPPAGGYASTETAISGSGRTGAMDSGFPGSRITAIRARVEIPGATRVRFFGRSLNSGADLLDIGLPDPTDAEWYPLVLDAEPPDPTGFGRWYTWDGNTEFPGRYFFIGYLLDPDPGADLAPVLSAVEVTIEPRRPPRPPQDLQWAREDDGRIHISWSPDAEDGLAGWWISWGPRPGDYASTGVNDSLRGSAWIPRGEFSSGTRPEFVWPLTEDRRIVYASIRSAWEEASPIGDSRSPGDYRALSDPTRELNFRP